MAFASIQYARNWEDVDDVEFFERRINAMLTIGIKKEDITEAPASYIPNLKHNCPFVVFTFFVRLFSEGFMQTSAHGFMKKDQEL